ncbi:MAG: hypothetical protein AB7K09_15515 [Planctomycetota bacterium]
MEIRYWQNGTTAASCTVLRDVPKEPGRDDMLDYGALKDRLHNAPATVIDDWAEFVHPHAEPPDVEWRPSFAWERLFPAAGGWKTRAAEPRWLLLARLFAAEQTVHIYERVARDVSGLDDVCYPRRELARRHAALWTSGAVNENQEARGIQVLAGLLGHYAEAAGRRSPDGEDQRRAHALIELAVQAALECMYTKRPVCRCTGIWLRWVRLQSVPLVPVDGHDRRDPLFRRLRQQWWNVVTSRMPFREGPLVHIEWAAPLAMPDHAPTDEEPEFCRDARRHERREPLQRSADPDGPIRLRSGRAVARERLLADADRPSGLYENQRRHALRLGQRRNPPRRRRRAAR